MFYALIFKLTKGKLSLAYMALIAWWTEVKLRKKAHRMLKEIRAHKGQSLINPSLKKQIKQYCKSVFGSRRYWPWLAVYTELRGEFKKGWIPSDYYTARLIVRLNPRNVAWLGMQKTLNYRIFGERSVRPLLIIVGHQVFDPDFQPISMDQATERLRDYRAEVFIKPDDEYGGKHIRICDSSEVDLNEYIGKVNCVIQPSVKQHALLEKIYPKSVNTLRIMTYIDSQTRVHVIYTLLRVGAHGNRIDNTSKGGRYFYVDEDGKVLSNAYDGSGLAVESRHPDTGIVYKDIIVPSVKEAMKLCMDAHLLYPYIGLIAWDIYIDTEGNPGIIEWNTWLPGFWMPEAHVGPLLNPYEIL